MNLIAKCPITEEEVFPDLSSLRAGGLHIVICPACRRKHVWKPGNETLVDYGSGDQAEDLEAPIPE